MRRKLQRKVTEVKPGYSREEIQWLLEHLRGCLSRNSRRTCFYEFSQGGFKKGVYP